MLTFLLNMSSHVDLVEVLSNWLRPYSVIKQIQDTDSSLVLAFSTTISFF